MNHRELSREEQNKILRKHGYHWEKITQDWLDANDDFETRPGWHLYAADHREVSVDRAFREIEIGVEATADEIRQIEEAELKTQKIARELARVRRQTAETIQARGVRPDNEQPAGGRILDTSNIYGGGDWFVINDEYIWYVRNNGMDGDDWSHNNVSTGGAGGIGWKMAMDEEIKATLLGLEDGSMKAKLEHETEAPVPGYMVRTKLVDMNGEHVLEIGRAEYPEQVEKLVDDHFHMLQYEGVDSVDIEVRDNLEVLLDGALVGKCNRDWRVEWLR